MLRKEGKYVERNNLLTKFKTNNEGAESVCLHVATLPQCDRKDCSSRAINKAKNLGKQFNVQPVQGVVICHF